jgi:hypothetical protein
MLFRHDSGSCEDFAMVHTKHRQDETEGSRRIGRRVGGEIETVGVAPAVHHLTVREVGGRGGGRTGRDRPRGAASGGIHTASSALSMVAAGATRIGASSTEAILDGLRPLAEATKRG